MRIKAKLRGTTQYNETLDTKKIVLPISVSHLYHEGDKLLATIKLIKKRFAACDIIVSDTLQRYNLLPHHEMEEATRLTYQLGTEWIERNIHMIDNSPIPFRIIRWNECLTSPGYPSALEKIRNQFNSDLTLQSALNHDITKFIERKESRSSMNNFIQHSRDYFFEEAAIVISFFIENKYDFIVYPSPIPKFIEACRDFFTTQDYPNLIRDLRIYFKKMGSDEIMTS